ncbi:MAG TPA: hypothetical protein VGO52_27160 [Hyphomonadaceae bacterium]|nr:hypothetical protein [Hyphomonadaceae bacterium]
MSALVLAATHGREAWFSIEDFRQAIATTLADIREDQAAHGDPVDVPFFDLVMFDANPVDEALFLVAIFSDAELKIYAGRAVPGAVISFGDQFAMSDVEEMETALKGRPDVAREPVSIPRSLAEFWLSR